MLMAGFAAGVMTPILSNWPMFFAVQTIKYTAETEDEKFAEKSDITSQKTTGTADKSELPVMYVKDHCPKCKGAEQRFKLAKVDYSEVNCNENMDIARELNILQTPTIIDPDGTRYEGANAASEWLKAHSA